MSGLFDKLLLALMRGAISDVPVVQRESAAASFITAYESGIVFVVETHGFQIVEDFTVMTIGFLAVFGLFFLICITVEGKSFFVYIYPM